MFENVASNADDVVLRAHPVPTDRRLDIRVLGPDGRPASGISVRLDVHEDGVRSDSQGRAAFEDLPALPIGIELEWTPSRERPWTLPEAPEVVPDAQVVEIRFVRGRVLQGRMLLPDGSACREGTVRMASRADSMCGHSESHLTVRPQIPRETLFF